MTLVFDHNKPATIVTKDNIRYLKQAGELFTYGEWISIDRKYRPEPKFLGEDAIMTDLTRETHDLLKKNMKVLKDQMERITQAIAEYGEAAHKKRARLTAENVGLRAEVKALRLKLGGLEKEGKILDLKEQIKEIEETPRNEKRKK